MYLDRIQISQSIVLQGENEEASIARRTFQKSLGTVFIAMILLSIPVRTGHPRLESILKVSRQSERTPGQFAAWVEFSDKGFDDDSSTRLAIARATEQMSARSRKRRLRVSEPDIADLNDVPVATRYAAAVERLVTTVRTRSKWLNAVSVQATPSELERVSNLPFVKRVRPVEFFRKALQPKVTKVSSAVLNPSKESHQLDYGPSGPQLGRCNVPAAHDLGLNGAGILICALDVGFSHDQHEALAPVNVVHEWDFLENDNDTDGPQGSHGMQVLAMSAAFKPGQLIGSAYGADYMVARTEDAAIEFLGEEDLWVTALEWADSLGADIVTSSLINAGLHDFSELDGRRSLASRAASQAAARGILVCNGVGNSGPLPRTLLSPADADSMLSVGSVDATGSLSVFSSRGPTADGRIKPEILAVGQAVVTVEFGTVSGYSIVNGTSFSTPLAAGVAALVMQNHPQWGPMQVREALMMTANLAFEPDNDWGWGLIDAVQASFYKSIGGAVTDSATGATLKGVNIEFSGPLSGKLQTRDNGRFLMEDLEPGEYVLTASGPGYKPMVQTVQVPDWVADADFALVLDPAAEQHFQEPPEILRLSQNYPNPFNPQTTIPFFMSAPATVVVEVFDIRGRKVRELENRLLPAGFHSVTWDATDAAANQAASGVYFYQVRSKTFAQTGKMILAR